MRLAVSMDSQSLGQMKILSNSDMSVIPFLKWPGGKRWFVANYSHLLPQKFVRYIEPFLGAGSVFFYLKPAKAILSDLNGELIATYQAIRDGADKVNERLIFHQLRHGHDYYYAVRESRPRLSSNKASRLIYLNRTCFNGVYRVNLNGDFNVPKGSKSEVVLDSDNFDFVACMLKNAIIQTSDFEPIIDGARRGDLVFADPPYTVRHNVNGFVKYNEQLFSWEDQIRLADVLARARARGVKIVLTNANHFSIRRLYSARGFSLMTVSRHSCISASVNSRKQFEELVIRSF
jgi:DNA adenine methylase